MKRNRKFALMMILVLLIGLLSGCTSAEKVVTKMAQTIADKPMTQASFNLPLSLSMTAAGETVDIEMNLDGSFILSEAPYSYYAQLNLEGDVMGESMIDRMDMYMTMEDGTFVMYLYSKSNDSWLRTDLGMTEEDIDKLQGMELDFSAIEYDPEALVMAEETETVGGKEAYVVSYTFPGTILQEQFDKMGGFSGMMEQAMDTAALGEEEAAMLETMDLSALDGLDLTVLSMPVTMYIDKSSYELVAFDMEYVGLQQMMDQIVDIILDLAMTATGMDAAALGMDGAISFEIPTLQLSMTDIGYGAVEVPAVPEEGVILGKQASFVPLQEDGSYVIQEYGDAVRVVPVADQAVTNSDYCTLQMSSDDGNAASIYSMLGSDWSEQDIKDYVASQLDALAQQGLKGTIEDSTVGDYTVQTIKVQGLKLFNAWKQVGDGWIVVEAYDFYNGNQNGVLQTALDAVSEYTLP